MTDILERMADEYEPYLLGANHDEDKIQAPDFSGPEDMDPQHDWVLCQQLPKTRTKSGIVLVESEDDERFIYCFVWKTGPGRLSEFGHRSEMVSRPGDIIYLSHRPVGGFSIFNSDDGRTRYWLVRDRDFASKASAESRAEFERDYPQLYERLAKLSSAE